MSASDEPKPDPTFREILDKASASAIRGGTAGAIAMGLNVGALMWMRTTVRVQRENLDRKIIHGSEKLIITITPLPTLPI